MQNCGVRLLPLDFRDQYFGCEIELTGINRATAAHVLSIMYSKEDILFAALKVNPARIDSYCQPVDEPILEEIRKLPSGASMDQLKDRWYRGRDGSDYHYHQSRYHAFYAQKKRNISTFSPLP